jgi:two-component sensor histidine kinase/tetratricopeptide (TPR) repeat protein
MRHFSTVIVFAFFNFVLFGQTNKAIFLKEFESADVKGKVKMVAEAEFSDIKDIYPRINDTLEAIKSRIYKTSSSNEARFLFDKIEAKQELYFKRHANAAVILETALSNHSQNIFDSLYCYRQLKEIYIKLSNLNKAVEANMYFDKLALRSGDEKYIKWITKKSKVYDVFGLNRQAIIEKRNEFNEEYAGRKNDTDFIAGYYNDMGVYYNRLKLSDSALPYFNKAYELVIKKLGYTSNKPHYQFFKGLIEGNKAMAFANKGDYKKAIPLLKNDVYYSLRVNDLESAFNSYTLLSKCLMKENNLTLARLYADSALYLKQRIGTPRVNLNSLFMEAELFEREGKGTAASQKYKEYILLKDSISNYEKEMKLINEQVALDIQKKDILIQEKNLQLQTSEINAAKQRAFRAYLLAGLFILLLLILFMFYTNTNIKKRETELAYKNSQIEKQNLLIENSLKEKEMLLKEIHHRVKNNLQIISSVINLQVDKLDDKKLKDILEEIKMRISSIALTHQMLYQKNSLNHVLLNEFIETLLNQIENSYQNPDVTTAFVCNTKDIKLNIDIAIPLGLLINEMVTNAYKHAFKQGVKGQITVITEVEKSQLKVTVKDNGKGLSPDQLEISENAGSLGFELISILSQQLNAKLKASNQNGTIYTMEFEI